MAGERITHKNPGKGYRIPVERLGEFRILQCGSTIAMYGDIVDKLGQYEDSLSLSEAQQYAAKKGK